MLGLVKDLNTKWWIKFAEVLESKKILYRLIDVERNNWISQVSDLEHIIWRPNLSEPYFSQAKEKLVFLEKYMNKKVFPNYDTFWHYNNKNAQSYLATIYEIPFPTTLVSYSYDEIMEFLKSTQYPIVSKSKGGSASRNVRKYNNFKSAKIDVEKIFRKKPFYKVVDKIFSLFSFSNSKYSGQFGYVNLQHFVEGNTRDFRVTTIGGQYAYAYFRNNRKGDFRASGSGLNDYSPEEHNQKIIKFFIELSKKAGFDSMCYDILLGKAEDFFCVEFSYIYVDSYLHRCPGYYELNDGKLSFVSRNTWPQELIVNHLVKKWQI